MEMLLATSRCMTFPIAFVAALGASRPRFFVARGYPCFGFGRIPMIHASLVSLMKRFCTLPSGLVLHWPDENK